MLPWNQPFKNYKTKVIDNNKISVDVKANVKINDDLHNIHIVKKFGANRYNITVTGEKMTFLDLLVNFRVRQTFYKEFCLTFNRDVLENLEFKKFRIHGVSQNDKGFYLIASAFLKNSQSNDKTNIEIIIMRMRRQPVKLAITIKGKLQSLILPFMNDVLKRNHNNIPIIDKTNDVGVLTISGPGITKTENDKNTSIKPVSKGINLITISAFEDVNHRSKLSQHSKLSVVPDAKSLFKTKLKLCETRDQIEFDSNRTINLQEFLQKLYKYDEITFPDWLIDNEIDNDVIMGKIQKVSFTGGNRNKVSVVASIETNIELLFGSLKLDSVNIELLIDKNKDDSLWNCGIAETKHKLGTGNHSNAIITLACDEGLKNFRLIISIPCFGFTEVIDLLKVNVIPDSLKESLASIANFQIKDFRIEASKGEDDFMR